MIGPPPDTSLEPTALKRLWSKIEVTGFCWLWTAGTDGHGYGKFKVGREDRAAYRVVYEVLVGSIPAGLQLDHLCRVPRCVNPDHLEPVTHLENHRRGLRATKTHCIKGHRFDETNTQIRSGNGQRVCRACHTDSRRISDRKRRQAARSFAAGLSADTATTEGDSE